MRTQPLADHEPLTFRGVSLDQAIEAAEAELGPRIRVLGANHIRRGGIGGFFASDLGVEITVAVEEETAEEALGRIVEETAIQERDRWRERIDSVAEAAVPTRPTFAETMRRVDPEPVAEPQLTSHPHALHPSARPEATVPALDLPHLPPVFPTVPLATRPMSHARANAADPVERMARLEAAFATLREQAGAIPTRDAAPTRGATAPTRRHVELAVAAADQLIDGIMARRCGTDQLSVRVVMRSAHGAEIEIHTQWSATGEQAR